MLLKVDVSSDRPLHEQLASEIRQAIANKDIKKGDRLPPARELARSLKVNVHTLLRAYQTLREEGLLEVRRGRGTMVSGTAPGAAQFSDMARTLVTEARRAGLDNNQIRHLVETHLRANEPHASSSGSSSR